MAWLSTCQPEEGRTHVALKSHCVITYLPWPTYQFRLRHQSLATMSTPPPAVFTLEQLAWLQDYFATMPASNAASDSLSSSLTSNGGAPPSNSGKSLKLAFCLAYPSLSLSTLTKCSQATPAGYAGLPAYSLKVDCVPRASSERLCCAVWSGWSMHIAYRIC